MLVPGETYPLVCGDYLLGLFVFTRIKPKSWEMRHSTTGVVTYVPFSIAVVSHSHVILPAWWKGAQPLAAKIEEAERKAAGAAAQWALLEDL
jgi:hypothetical protein